LEPAKVRVVPPGVRALPPAKAANKPRVVCAGALQPHKGFYEAIWAFDLLRYLYDEVELAIAGEGPQRQRLEEFADGIGQRHRIHLPGEVPDIAQLLAQAVVVWVPSLVDTGAGVALDAMAAGLPVVASRWPALAELVIDGQTGFLVEPGNKMDLARQTRRLLDDPALRRRLGEAGRRRAGEMYSSGAFVESWTRACLEAA